jgi:hypothetical protein
MVMYGVEMPLFCGQMRQKAFYNIVTGGIGWSNPLSL